MNGRDLKDHRKRRLRLSQAALADRLGVHPLTVGRWEKGAHPIPHATALLIETFKGKGGRPKKRRR